MKHVAKTRDLHIGGDFCTVRAGGFERFVEKENEPKAA